MKQNSLIGLNNSSDLDDQIRLISFSVAYLCYKNLFEIDSGSSFKGMRLIIKKLRVRNETVPGMGLFGKIFNDQNELLFHHSRSCKLAHSVSLIILLHSNVKGFHKKNLKTLALFIHRQVCFQGSYHYHNRKVCSSNPHNITYKVSYKYAKKLLHQFAYKLKSVKWNNV